MSEQMTLTAEYYFDEYCRFRRIMCYQYDTDLTDRALRGLTFVYMNVKEDDPKLSTVISIHTAVCEEWVKRHAYLIFRP